MVLINSQTLHDKPCAVCEKLFSPNSGQHTYCSEACKGRVKYITGYGSTENQYKRISYNWRRYLQRLLYPPVRKKLTIDYLLSLLEAQDYRCALSGEPLTCILGKGMVNFTNASIDRTIPGSEYVEGNVRLVCRIANIMKWNMQDKELHEWCWKIIKHGT